MPPNAQARQNHEALFPGHVSTLAITDPELIDLFDNFAFDAVLRESTLDTRTRLMVQLAALIACQALSEYRVMLGAALTVGVTPVEVKEIVYQAVPYVGMAKVFDFLHATNDVLTERGISCLCRDNRPPLLRTALRKAVTFKSRSLGMLSSKTSMRPHPTTRCISSAFCRPIALAITSRAPALTCPPASS